MPVFEYKCRDCGTVSEFLVGVTSTQPEILCADCGGAHMNRMISTINVGSSHGSERFPIAGGCACAEAGVQGHGCGDGCACSA
jgi:putative FmdB family regulatory protein